MVAVDFEKAIVWIKWIGSHKAYDRIDVTKDCSMDLEPLIGTRARVAEVMTRKRTLSIDMIRRLHDRPGISAEVLIRPTRHNEAA